MRQTQTLRVWLISDVAPRPRGNFRQDDGAEIGGPDVAARDDAVNDQLFPKRQLGGVFVVGVAGAHRRSQFEVEI